MLRDILEQPESLKQVLEHQFGRGAHVLEQAADTIRSVPTIIVTGMGASLYGAMPLAYQLNSIGRACQVIEAGELLHFGGDLPRGALVIIVSRSGETVEAVNLLPKLRAARAHVIAVTNDRTSTLAREADLALFVNSRADEAVAVQSYTGTAMLSLLLAAEVMGREVREQADAAVETCKTMLDGEQDQDWNEFLGGANVVYLLGRGPSLASVHEGALLFNETAKLPSVAMAAGNFRHGPVEVVDADFRAVLFRSEPATEHLDGALRRVDRACGRPSENGLQRAGILLTAGRGHTRAVRSIPCGPPAWRNARKVPLRIARDYQRDGLQGRWRVTGALSPSISAAPAPRWHSLRVMLTLKA